MALTRQDYINYLLSEAKRKLVNCNSEFYKGLYLFLDSPQGIEGFEKFKKLTPESVGVKKTSPVSNVIKRMFVI